MTAVDPTALAAAALDAAGLVRKLQSFAHPTIDEAADTITRLSRELAAARGAIERTRNVIAFGYPRDGINPLRNGDTCSHGRLGHEDCIGCYDEALLAAMDGPPKDYKP